MPAPNDVGSKTEQFAVVSLMFDMMREMTSDLSSLKTAFEMHMNTEEDQREEVTLELKKLNEKIDEALKIKQAFPTDDQGEIDIAGHKNDHLKRRESDRSSKKMWSRIKEEVLSKVVTAIVISVAVIFALGLKEWFSNQVNAVVEQKPAVISTPDNKVGG